MPLRYFALRKKENAETLELECVARSFDGHKQKVNQAYREWTGAQPRDSDSSFQRFMQMYDEAQVIIDEKKKHMTCLPMIVSEV